MIIYLDVFLFENIIVNTFLLDMLMICIKHKYKISNILIGGTVGGIYSCILLIPGAELFCCLPVSILVACLMIRISYGKISIINMIKQLGVFLMLTFSLSGICFLLSINKNGYILGYSFEIQKYSIKFIVIGIMVMFIFISRLFIYIKDREFVKNYLYILSFEIQGIKFEVDSFLDTGNELREPITNLPCILVENSKIESISLNNNNSYVIPYNAIGYKGNIRGIRVKNIMIRDLKNSFTKEVEAIICPCKEKLSRENEYSALLSRGVI